MQKPSICSTSIAFYLAALLAPAAAATSVWTSGTGFWDDSSCWSNGIPDAATVAVIGQNGSAASHVTASGVNAIAVANLTVNAGDALTIVSSTSSPFIVGAAGSLRAIQNTGTINLGDPSDATATSTGVLYVSGSVTLSGGGTVVLGGGTSSWSQIEGNNAPADSGPHALINVDNTITGFGALGANLFNGSGVSGNMQIVNRGLIDGAGPGGALTVSPNAAGLINSGTIGAREGGVVAIGACNPNFATSGPANIAITNTGGTIVASGFDPTLGNYINPLNFSNGSGFPTLPMVNQWPSNGASVVALNAADLSGGVLKAENQGVVLIGNGTVDSTTIVLSGSGTLGLCAWGPVTLSNLTVNGDPASGVVVLPSLQAPYVSGTFENVNFQGGLPVTVFNTTVMLKGTVGNTGTINLGNPNDQSASSTGMFTVSGTVTLSGGGTIQLCGGNFWSQIDGNADPADPGPHTLINVDNTITGFGALGANLFNWGGSGNMQIVNRGLIEGAGSTGSMSISPSAAGLINSGTIRARDGGVVVVGAYNPYYPPSDPANIAVNNTGGAIVATGIDPSFSNYISPINGNGGGFPNLPFVNPWPSPGSSVVALNAADVSGGVLKAEDQGVLLISNGSVDHTAINLSGSGALGLCAWGPVTLSNLTVTGDATSGVAVLANTQFPYVSGTFENVNFQGGLPVTFYSSVAVAKGTLGNTGTINLGDPNDLTGTSTGTLYISGSVALSGGGTVRLGGGDSTTFWSQIDGNSDPSDTGPHTLVNVDNTIRGTGVVGGSFDGINYTSNMKFINGPGGTVVSGSGDVLRLIANSASETPIRNEGTFSIEAGGSMNVLGDYLQTSTGTFDLQPGGAATFTGNVINSGTFTVNGATATVGGTFTNYGALLVSGSLSISTLNADAGTTELTQQSTTIPTLNIVGDATVVLAAHGDSDRNVLNVTALTIAGFDSNLAAPDRAALNKAAPAIADLTAPKAVPEPATWNIVASGLGLFLAAWRPRRRNRSSKPTP